MSDQATPRPWEQGSVVRTMIGHPEHDALNSWWLVARLTKKKGRGEADAALIVRAVNAHDDLVAALRELVSLIPSKFNSAPAFDNAREVLAKVSA